MLMIRIVDTTVLMSIFCCFLHEFCNNTSNYDGDDGDDELNDCLLKDLYSVHEYAWMMTTVDLLQS